MFGLPNSHTLSCLQVVAEFSLQKSFLSLVWLLPRKNKYVGISNYTLRTKGCPLQMAKIFLTRWQWLLIIFTHLRARKRRRVNGSHFLLEEKADFINIKFTLVAQMWIILVFFGPFSDFCWASLLYVHVRCSAGP